MTQVEEVRLTDSRPRKTSVQDTAMIGTTVLLPMLARGILARRPKAVAVAEGLQADRMAGRVLQRMRAKYGEGPLELRLPLRRMALVLSPEDVERVLAGSPEPFAVASKEKRAALAHFQPHGLLTSHGAERADQRRFNEAVLDTPHEVHRHGEQIVRVLHEEAAQLLQRIDEHGTLAWPEFRVVWWRVVRRVVLGDSARDDHRITDLLTRLRMEANWGYAPRRPGVYREFRERLEDYLRRAEPGSLAELVATTAQSDMTEAADQVPQWLFAFEPAGMAAFRALALLTAHPAEAAAVRAELAGQDLTRPHDLPFLRSCVLESVRLWPTTLAILRDTTRDVDWNGLPLPEGTGLMIPTPFVNRDEERLPFADAFLPAAWRDGTAQASWSTVPFSAGPAECPGRNLVLLTTSSFLAMLLRDHDYEQIGGRRLDRARPLPRTLSPFRLRFAARRRH
jgi:cytochrome P450